MRKKNLEALDVKTKNKKRKDKSRAVFFFSFISLFARVGSKREEEINK